MRYQREFLKDIWDELIPLLGKHYLEIAHYQDIELDPNKDMYMKMDDMGMCRAFTMRDTYGHLVGYQVFFVRVNMHYSKSLQAVQDVLWIEKEMRGAGHEFIQWCDVELKSEGVQVVVQHMKAAHPFGKTLEKMDYVLQDLIYTRRLDKMTDGGR